MIRALGATSLIAAQASMPGALGHPDVEQDDVGQQFGSPLDRCFTVGCFADDLDVRFLDQHHFEATPKQRVVVDDEHANRIVVRLSPA